MLVGCAIEGLSLKMILIVEWLTKPASNPISVRYLKIGKSSIEDSLCDVAGLIHE